MADIEVSSVNDPEGLTALREEWQQLMRRSASATPFQSWEWNTSWWRHLGRGALWLLLARRRGELVGLAPLFLASYRCLPFRRVTFLGVPISDYHDIVCADEDAPACWSAFLGHLGEHRHRWDLVDAANLPRPAHCAAPAGFGLAHLDHRVCPYLVLPPTWEQFSAQLGRNLRTNLGRRRRKLEREFRVEFDLASSGSLPAALDDLFRLHSLRWGRRRMAGAFADPRVRRFHREVAALFAERGWLRLHRLRLNGETRAAFYCFQGGRRCYYYLSGFDPDFASYGIGNVIMAHAIEHAIGEGVEEFDLMRGQEEYKSAWRAAERQTARMVLTRRSLRSLLSRGVLHAELVLEQRGGPLRERVMRPLWRRWSARPPA